MEGKILLCVPERKAMLNMCQKRADPRHLQIPSHIRFRIREPGMGRF